MSTKKINAGDALTVGDLTDDHLGAVIEVGPIEGITSRMQLERVVRGIQTAAVYADDGGFVDTFTTSPITVITPPPVVQPNEPTELGQCIRIEGHGEWRAVVAEPGDDGAPIRDTEGSWFDWDLVLIRAGDRQIVVSDPPRWPDETPEADETPEVPERIEVGEWPKDDDTHLRDWEWIDADGDPWWWDAQADRWRSEYGASDLRRPIWGPWTRGERVK